MSHYFPSSFKLSNFSQNFPTAAKLSNFSETFQLQKKLSNFARFFPTSIGSFQFRLSLSNFSQTFQLQTFQLKTFQLLVLPNCPFQLHVSQKITQKIKLSPGNQDFCLDFVSRNDARWRTQNKFFEIFLDFVSENDARWRTQFLDFVSEICQYGLMVNFWMVALRPVFLRNLPVSIRKPVLPNICYIAI